MKNRVVWPGPKSTVMQCFFICFIVGLARSISLSVIKHGCVGQKLDGRPPDERPKQLTPPSFGRDVKLGVPCLDEACIVGLK